MTQTIGVFFGSRNPEHDVSIITGQLIISGLKKLGYAVVAVYIDKEGKWFIGEEYAQLTHFSSQQDNRSQDARYYLDIESSHGKFVLKQKGLTGKTVQVDLAFPAFHGQNGEDGTFQGMCELFDVPYVGCNVAASAVTMDKVMTKQLYRAEQLPTTDFVFFSKDEWLHQKDALLAKIEDHIGLPVIIKPARLGSSIGISKAKTRKDLEFGIDVACHYDTKVIVETCVPNLMDVTCAVIGNTDLIASKLQESVFADDVFSYENKYLDEGGAQLGAAKNSIVIPARLSKTTTTAIQETAKRVYKLIGCSGIARVDFLYDTEKGTYFVNEVNTLPGTLYHHLWKASGIELSELLTKLIAYANEMHVEQTKVTHVFNSTILKHASSSKMKLKGL